MCILKTADFKIFEQKDIYLFIYFLTYMKGSERENKWNE